MKVGELIEELSKHPLDAVVMATWESIFREVSIYRALDGTVVLDADDDRYRDDIETGKLVPQDNSTGDT